MKQKQCVKAVALLLAAASAVLPAASCGKKKIADTPDTVEVLIYDAGYGIDWFKEAKTRFEAKTDYKVEYNTVSSENNIESMIRSGASNNTVDLFIVGESFSRYIYAGNKMVSGYEYCLEPLDEVLAYTPEGESKTLGEKMWKSYVAPFKSEIIEGDDIEEHYYSLPWASGFSGIFYNKKIFTEAELTKEPRTTEELAEYCATLKSKCTPIIHSSDSGYWEYLFNAWWAQYETLHGIDNFYNGKINDAAIPDAAASMGIFDQKGIKASLQAISSLIDPASGYTDEVVESYDFVTAQARFITGQAAIMPNGDWLENEMKKLSVDTSNIMPMTTPVISAISDKLSYWDKDGAYADITLTAAEKTSYDEKLRALVDYVDGAAQLPSYADEATVKADAAIVAEARKTNYSIGNLHSVAIPVYATAKEGAKEFLKFMYSDEILSVYMQTTSGALLPFDYDFKNDPSYAELSDFAKKKLEILSTSNLMLMPNYYPSAYIGGLAPVSRSAPYEILLGSRDSKTRTSVDKLLEHTKNYFSSRMGKLLSDSGLL